MADIAPTPIAASSAPAVTTHTIVVQLVQPKEAAPVHPSVYLTPAVAFVAAGVAGYIAFLNRRTAQNKLKLDLYDRRVALYDGMRQDRVEVERLIDMIEASPSHLTAIPDIMDRPFKVITESNFLFSVKAHRFVQQHFMMLLKISSQLNEWKIAFDRDDDDKPEARRIAEELVESRRSLDSIASAMIDAFKAEIRIDHN